MKTTKIFTIAAWALMLSACSSNEIEQIGLQPNNKTEGIPFTATISIGESATTRALSESGSTLVPSWEKGDKVALIHNGVNDEMEVQSVYNGIATITGTINGDPVNGDDVTIIYPSSAVDETTKDIKANLLAVQDGKLATIAEKYDVRKGTGKLNVGETASLQGNVSLANQLAIVKFTLTDGTNAINATEFTIKDGSDNVITTVTSSPAASDLCVAMAPASAATFNFAATVGTEAYTYTKAGVTLAAGSYYQSSIKMTSNKHAGTIEFSKTADSQTWSATAADNTYQLAATVTGDGTVTYSVNADNTCGATINASTGALTFTKVGTVTVTATVADSETYTYASNTATYTLTINKAEGTISFAKDSESKLTTDAPFTITLTNTGDGSVSYSSDKTSVAEVNTSTGEVTIKGAGTATITATVTDGTNYTYATKSVAYSLTVTLPTTGGSIEDYGVETETNW
jgi:hypothetical protein